MNIDPKLVAQWCEETPSCDIDPVEYIAQRAAEYGAQQERERLLQTNLNVGVCKVADCIGSAASMLGLKPDAVLYTAGQLAAARLRGEQDAQAKKPDSHALPIAYIKHRQGKIDWDSDDNCVISNTPGDCMDESIEWRAVTYAAGTYSAYEQVNQRLLEALKAAATSLETISYTAGTIEGHLDTFANVRGYSGSRAGVARAAIAESEGSSHE